MRILSNRYRVAHLGPLPLERVARARTPPDLAALCDAFPPPSTTPLGRIVNEYIAALRAVPRRGASAGARTVLIA